MDTELKAALQGFGIGLVIIIVVNVLGYLLLQPQLSKVVSCPICHKQTTAAERN